MNFGSKKERSYKLPAGAVPTNSLTRYSHLFLDLLEKMKYQRQLGFWGDQITMDLSSKLKLSDNGGTFYIDWGNITGGEPNFLDNNTIYPIASQQITDELKTAEADKGETDNTDITDDEMEGIPYDKEGSGLALHREKMNEGIAAKGLWRISATGDTTNECFVYKTTGNVLDASGTRRSLSPNDILNIIQEAKRRGFNQNLVLVLTTQHIFDLVRNDIAFKDLYLQNTQNGVPIKYYGLTILEDNTGVYYNLTTLQKLAYAASPVSGTHEEGSVGFRKDKIVKAFSDVYTYMADSKTNPEYRKRKFGTRRYHLHVPKGEVYNCQVSIVNGY
jgi:hypothetical protein